MSDAKRKILNAFERIELAAKGSAPPAGRLARVLETLKAERELVARLLDELEDEAFENGAEANRPFS